MFFNKNSDPIIRISPKESDKDGYIMEFIIIDIKNTQIRYNNKITNHRASIKYNLEDLHPRNIVFKSDQNEIDIS